MPIAEVQFPDGRIGQFEVPETATPAEIEAFASSQINTNIQAATNRNAELERRLAARPTQNNMAENFGLGLIQGGKSAVVGTLGLGSDLLANKFPENKALQDFRSLLAEAQASSNIQYQARTGDSVAAGVGNVLGQAAPFFLLPASAATIYGRVGMGLVSGAIGGATAPSEVQRTPEAALKERQIGAAIGGTIGATAPVVMKAAPALIKKLANINPVAAKDFLDTGVQTSLGALSNSPAIKLGDKWLSKFVGSAGVMQKNTAKTLDDIQQIVNQTGAEKGVTSQEAGRIIQEGGENYIKRFQQTSRNLFNRLDNYIKPDSLVPVNNSLDELQTIVASAPTPNLLERIQGNKGVNILQDISTDAQNGTLPYKALKQYRTLIGEELSTPHLIGGTEIPIYKRAYAALTKDMQTAAQAQGSKAINTFNKANSFYARGITEIEDNLQRVILKNTPEEAYQAAISGTSKGGTRIKSIMRSLKPNEREIVQGTVLRQLGLAKPGAQDATGELFSTNTFLTNWNKLSPEAKEAIFRNKTTVDSLNKVARISNNINNVDRFGNPSGTAQQVGVGGVLLGTFINPAATAGVVGGANIAARLMTNQKFVTWLAKAAIAKSPQSLGQELTKLKQIARQNPSIANDIASYITTIGVIATRNKE